MKKFIIFIALLTGFYFSHAQEWNWEVGNGGNSGRYSLAPNVKGPQSPDSILWQDGAISSFWPHQVFTKGDTLVTDRTFNISNTLHGTFIVAYRISDGTELWTADLPVDFPDDDWRNRACGISDSLVFATRSGNTNAAYLFALDLANGDIVWKSEDLVDMSSTEGVVYAENGDILIGNFHSVLRMDVSDGSTIWQTPRYSPTSGGSEVARYGNHLYGWSASSAGPKISVFDTEDGNLLYESRPIGGGIIQQIGPLVGPDGTVYAPRSANNPITDTLVAFLDNGTALKEQWKHAMAYIPFGTHGVGPDGSFYMYSRDSTILRIKDDGRKNTASEKIVINTKTYQETVISGFRESIACKNAEFAKVSFFMNRDVVPVDTSIFMFDPNAVVNSPSMAIDGEGNVYVANETRIFAFDKALNNLWIDEVEDVGYIALGDNGNLIVPAENDVIMVYGGRGYLYDVTFYVHDQFGDPLYEANIIIGQDSLLTDSDGEATFYLDPGQISYTVKYMGQSMSSTYEVTNSPDQFVDVEFIVVRIHETTMDNVHIYPNPASEKMIVSLPPDADPDEAMIELFSVEGKCLMTCKTVTSDNRLPLKNLVNGMYVVKIVLSDQIIVRKILVRQ